MDYAGLGGICLSGCVASVPLGEALMIIQPIIPVGKRTTLDPPQKPVAAPAQDPIRTSRVKIERSLDTLRRTKRLLAQVSEKWSLR